MKFSSRILSTAAAIAVTCVVSAAAYYYKSRTREINEVMVFCKLQFNAYNCFDKLISYVEAAKKSVCVCMSSIQNPAIQGRLLQLMRTKKVAVRIIIDRQGYNDTTDFLLKELIYAGAEIKCKLNGPYNMQHKYCVIDDKVLMTGTLNWGDDRSSDHWNYVYITTKPQLVEPVKTEFSQMWNSYPDIAETLDEADGSGSDESLCGTCSAISDIESDCSDRPMLETELASETDPTIQVTPEFSIL